MELFLGFPYSRIPCAFIITLMYEDKLISVQPRNSKQITRSRTLDKPFAPTREFQHFNSYLLTLTARISRTQYRGCVNESVFNMSSLQTDEPHSHLHIHKVREELVGDFLQLTKYIGYQRSAGPYSEGNGAQEDKYSSCGHFHSSSTK